MAHHLEIDELKQGGGLDVCLGPLDSYKQYRTHDDLRLTHILSTNLCAAFFQTVLDVFLLVSLVVPQASDEVVEGFLKPALLSAYMSLEGVPVAQGLCVHLVCTTRRPRLSNRGGL